jgi:trehalose 6-phosphate phosphatase
VEYLFDRIEKILAKLKRAKCIFFFFDYDGTLTPIVSRPEQAILSEKTKTLLQSIKKNPRFLLAIVSGRSLKDIRNLVGLKKIYYVGNHGLEIFTPRKGTKQIISEDIFQEFSRIRNRLNSLMKDVDGIHIEDKGCILTIHYRNVDQKRVPPILMELKREIKDSRLPLRLGYGKMVFEIRPESNINKGTAVLELLNQIDRDEVLPLYMGDDQTDEDAFKVLKRGITIFVGLPTHSLAQYYINDPVEVHTFLDLIQTEFG